MFHLLCIGLSLFVPKTIPEKFVSDTLIIQFENNSHKIDPNSLGIVYTNSAQIIKARAIQILIPNYTISQDLSVETLKKIEELKDLLESEGATMSLVEELRIEKTASRNGLKLDKNKLGLKITYPMSLLVKSIPENPNCAIDTTIFQHDGMGINLRMCDYLEIESLPLIELVKQQQNNGSKEREDFHLIKEFVVSSNESLELTVMIPLNEKLNIKEIKLACYNEAEHLWTNEFGDTISIRKIDKQQFAALQISKSGRYRLTKQNRSMPFYVLVAPKNYGIKQATISRNVEVKFDCEKLLGSTVIAFQLQDNPSEYTVELSLIDAHGKLISLPEMKLDEALKKESKRKSFFENKQIGWYCNGSRPEKVGLISLPKATNDLVSR